jgi:hypothetical protein
MFPRRGLHSRRLHVEPLEHRFCLSATLPGFDAHTLPPTDDGSSAEIALPFTINFYGQSYDHLYVNNNGNVTFGRALSTFTPFGLTTNIGTPIIAAYFADVDTRGDFNGVVTYGLGTLDGHAAFGVTYSNVGYFAQHTDKQNTFQLIIVDRSDLGSGPAGDDFDIIFNYDQIQWETGDASSGSHGVGGFSAVAGFSNGSGQPGTFFQIQGSGINGGFLDSNSATGLVHNRLNSDVLGRFVFHARNGGIEGTKSSVSGTIVEDTGQGAQGLGGVTVYVDLNGNGQFDAGEPSAVSRADDPNTLVNEAGQYVIGQLPAGRYSLRVVLPAGFRQSSPSGGEAQGLVLPAGLTVTGIDFHLVDEHREAVTKTPAPAPAATITTARSNAIPLALFAGPAGAPAPFGALPPTSPSMEHVREIYGSGQNSLAGPDSPGALESIGDSGVAGGRPQIRLDAGSADEVLAQLGEEDQFAALLEPLPAEYDEVVIAARLGSIAGHVWWRKDQPGAHQQTAPAGKRLLYLDANGNGKLDADEPRQMTGDDGVYRFTDLPAGIHTVRLLVDAATDKSSQPIEDADVRIGPRHRDRVVDFAIVPLDAPARPTEPALAPAGPAWAAWVAGAGAIAAAGGTWLLARARQRKGDATYRVWHTRVSARRAIDASSSLTPAALQDTVRERGERDVSQIA